MRETLPFPRSSECSPLRYDELLLEESDTSSRLLSTIGIWRLEAVDVIVDSSGTLGIVIFTSALLFVTLEPGCGLPRGGLPRASRAVYWHGQSTHGTGMRDKALCLCRWR
jgi:hypothetical protein